MSTRKLKLHHWSVGVSQLVFGLGVNIMGTGVPCKAVASGKQDVVNAPLSLSSTHTATLHTKQQPVHIPSTCSGGTETEQHVLFTRIK